MSTFALRKVMKISKLWKSPKIDLSNFRSDNHFLWQTRLYNKANYYLSYQEALKVDVLNVFSKSLEDAEWGAECFRFNEILVSRDLLDSVFEINFLSKNLELGHHSKFKVLDIGAGYGRLGKRLLDVFSGAEYFATDAVAISQSVSKTYLKDYIEEGRATVIDFAEVSNLSTLVSKIDLMVNIHSFSEMTIEFVDYWLKLAQSLQIPYLFIIPNNQKLALNDGADLHSLVVSHGYSPFRIEKKYSSQIPEDLVIYPDTFFLFKSNLQQ